MPQVPVAMGGGAAGTGADGDGGCTRGVEAEYSLEQQIELVVVGAGQQARAGQREWVAPMDQQRHWQRLQCH